MSELKVRKLLDEDGCLVEVFDANETNRYIAHQKYKRCLAMADYCLNREKFISSIAPHTETKKQVWEYCTNYWSRWERKWFKLAKQFKEEIK